MSDGIYEVTCVLDGKLVEYEGHAARLQRSARALDLNLPVDEAELLALHREIVARNGLEQGMIYLQLTRGAADRTPGPGPARGADPPPVKQALNLR